MDFQVRVASQQCHPLLRLLTLDKRCFRLSARINGEPRELKAGQTGWNHNLMEEDSREIPIVRTTLQTILLVSSATLANVLVAQYRIAFRK
jgi:hypothetical protein